jgi:hypothetical protein
LFCSFLIVSERLPLSQLFQVLLSLPSITPEGLGAFEVALSQTASAKEQRQQMKSFLLAAGGDQLKALKPQKNTSIITNVSNRNQTERGVHRDFANREELGGTMGLAAILWSLLPEILYSNDDALRRSELFSKFNNFSPKGWGQGKEIPTQSKCGNEWSKK